MEYQGAVDNREDKSKDFHWSELYASGNVVFPERASFGYTPRNQDGSSSCVAQTTAKMLEVWDFKHDNTPTVYSAKPIYSHRTNKPALGMSFIDAFSFTKNQGSYFEKDVPSQNLSEESMNDSTLTATPQLERPTTYLSMPVDFYAVASEIDRSGAVMVWVKCSYEEWNQDIPEGDSDSEAVRHSVCVVDKITWRGTEYLVLEDSWGVFPRNTTIPLKDGQRAITKKFFDKHCYFAGCFISFSLDGTIKPHHTWTQIMKYGQTSDDIKLLQDVLKYEKLFPSNQTSTGFFGGITAHALIKWQVAHNIFDFQNETNMAKVQVGTKSLAILNSLYNG